MTSPFKISDVMVNCRSRLCPEATTSNFLRKKLLGVVSKERLSNVMLPSRLSILSPVKSALKAKEIFGASYLSVVQSVRPEMIEAGGEIKQGVLPLVLEDALGV